MSKKKSGNQNCGKSYVTPVAKGNHEFQQKAASGSGTSEGVVSIGLPL